jgi:four helix bundle protein
MNPKAVALQQRLRRFVARVGALCDSLPRSILAQRIAPQLVDAAGSASSNYNGACRARSKREFVAKIGVAAEESSEALEWLLTLRESGIEDSSERDALIREADELTAILVASRKTAKGE